MRRYDDPVEVRKGMVGGIEGPEQFLWRGRLWKVCDVLAHWVETGPWWQSSGVHAVLGSDEAGSPPGDSPAGSTPGSTPAGSTPAGRACRDQVQYDLAAEREVWRVEAARGLSAASAVGGADRGAGCGVFDLVFDWAQGSWQLVRCVD